jgi:hypothetical protein
LTNDVINGFHSEPIATIYQWGPPLGLLDKETEVVRLIREVDALYAAFRYDATVIGLIGVRVSNVTALKGLGNILP